MTRWLKAAQQFGTRDNWDKTDKTPDAAPETGVLSLKSVLSGVPKPEAAKFKTPLSASDASPYGQTIGVRQLTWTGKVVSLADWRELSDWERHGSTGKMWNGITKQWEVKP